MYLWSPFLDISILGLTEIKQHLKKCSSSKKLHVEKSISVNGVCHNKITDVDAGRAAIDNFFLVHNKGDEVEVIKGEDVSDRLKRLMQVRHCV